MSREEAIQFVRQLEQTVNAHDTERLLDWYDKDAVMVSPVFGEITGRAAVAKSWSDVFLLFPDWLVKTTDVLLDGDRIAFLGTAGGTDRNGWFGQPATGKWIQYRAAIVLTMANGKIVREERIYDLTTLLQGIEKAQLDKELATAAEVQRSLLPRTVLKTEYCQSAGDSVPSRAIGGDFFELLELPSGDFAMALGDVSGKGAASALLASMIQGMLAVEVESGKTPSAILSELNRCLTRRSLEPRFATVVYGVLSPTGRFVYSSAGHNPPLMLSHDGLHRLSAGGTVLGAFSESRFEEETICLAPGDMVVMFSDGVTEACDARGDEFGDDRLATCITSVQGHTVENVVDRVLKSVQDFCKGSPQSDDITLTVTRFDGSG